MTRNKLALNEIMQMFPNSGELYNFIDTVFEIAFGDDAINKEYEPEEVLEKLRDFSCAALDAESKE